MLPLSVFDLLSWLMQQTLSKQRPVVLDLRNQKQHSSGLKFYLKDRLNFCFIRRNRNVPFLVKNQDSLQQIINGNQYPQAPHPFPFSDFYWEVVGWVFYFSSFLSSENGELGRPLYFLENFAQLDESFAEKFCCRVKLHFSPHNSS